MESAETDVAEQTNSTIGPKLAPYNVGAAFDNILYMLIL